MSYIFRNYVFEGGGVKGLAYVGALKVMEEKGIHHQIQRVAGASAGAICALLVALNYTSDEIKEKLWTLNFKNFMDSDWGVIQDTARLLKEYGWYKGDFFKSWIEAIIEERTGSKDTTFSDLHQGSYRDITFIGTNLSTHYSELFSYDTTPDMKLSEALRITMSIPFFFKAVQRNKQIYVDGGLLMNYPIKVFDRESYVEAHHLKRSYYDKANEDADNPYVYNKETLGFRLDSRGEIAVLQDHASPTSHKIDNFFDYMSNIITTVIEAQTNNHLHSDDWHRTVYINSLGIKTTDFDLTETDKENLIQSGYDHTMKYFEWYDKEDDIYNK